MTAVRCIDLCKTYRQGDQDIKALDHVDIEITQGGFVCLSAPSGGGKTTLLNAIGGRISRTAVRSGLPGNESTT